MYDPPVLLPSRKKQYLISNKEAKKTDFLLQSSLQGSEWDESKHPRADDGKFGHGSGGIKKEKSKDDVGGDFIKKQEKPNKNEITSFEDFDKKFAGDYESSSPIIQQFRNMWLIHQRNKEEGINYSLNDGEENFKSYGNFLMEFSDSTIRGIKPTNAKMKISFDDEMREMETGVKISFDQRVEREVPENYMDFMKANNIDFRKEILEFVNNKYGYDPDNEDQEKDLDDAYQRLFEDDYDLSGIARDIIETAITKRGKLDDIEKIMPNWKEMQPFLKFMNNKIQKDYENLYDRSEYIMRGMKIPEFKNMLKIKKFGDRSVFDDDILEHTCVTPIGMVAKGFGSDGVVVAIPKKQMEKYIDKQGYEFLSSTGTKNRPQSGQFLWEGEARVWEPFDISNMDIHIYSDSHSSEVSQIISNSDLKIHNLGEKLLKQASNNDPTIMGELYELYHNDQDRIEALMRWKNVSMEEAEAEFEGKMDYNKRGSYIIPDEEKQASNQWNEEDHPRDDDGKFGNGSGGTKELKDDNIKETNQQVNLDIPKLGIGDEEKRKFQNRGIPDITNYKSILKYEKAIRNLSSTEWLDIYDENDSTDQIKKDYLEQWKA